MAELKLIVAGGREFSDYELLSRSIEYLASNTYAEREVSIVSGMARGADILGYTFAVSRDVKKYAFPADWNTHGKAAGFIRNKAMGVFADALLAFWDGKSRGTADMIGYMRSLNKPVHLIMY